MLAIYLIEYGPKPRPSRTAPAQETVCFPWHSLVMAYLFTAQVGNTKEGASEENCKYVENQGTGSSYCPLLKLSNWFHLNLVSLQEEGFLS